MPTRRSLDALYALFEPGQAPGSITPDMVQDVIASLRPGWGRLSLTGGAAVVTIATQNTWTKVSVPTVLGADALGLSMPNNGELELEDTEDSRAVAALTINAQSSNNQIFEIAIAKNDTVDTTSICRIRIGSAGDSETASMNIDFRKSNGDVLSIYARNTSSDADLTINNLYFAVRTFIE